MKRLITFIAMSFFIFGCVGTAKSRSPLTVVDSVDLQRYLGRWYEIASYPAWFQKGCAGSTADYSLQPEGKIQVVNRCRYNFSRSGIPTYIIE